MMRLDQDISADLQEKIKLVLGKSVYISNESGFIVSEDNKGEFFPSAFRSIKEGSSYSDELSGVTWNPIYYDEKAIGAVGVETKGVSKESMSLIQGMAEVLVYQEYIVKNLFSVTNIRTSFVKELLTTENIKNIDEAIAQADVLKINLRAKQAVIVVMIEDFANNFLKRSQKLTEESKKLEFIDYAQQIELLIKKGFSDYDQNVVIYINDDKFVILKGMGEKENILKGDYTKFFKEKAKYINAILKKEFKNNTISIGVGQYYPGVEGLRKSFLDANLALEVGIKVWGKGSIYHILDVGTFASLSGNVSHSRKMEIAEEVLKPLTNDQDLLKTVQVFLSSGMNLTVASKELHLHRNTLIYRLTKVKKLIGLDPKRFQDALQIKLGFMMRTLG